MKRDLQGNLSFPYDRIILEYPGYNGQQVFLNIGKIDASAKKVNFDNVVLKQKKAVIPQKVEMTYAQ